MLVLVQKLSPKIHSFISGDVSYSLIITLRHYDDALGEYNLLNYPDSHEPRVMKYLQ